jgi:hypothetical protein
MNFVVIYIILQMSSELPDSQIPDLWLPMWYCTCLIQ